jgi:hypothetical protein
MDPLWVGKGLDSRLLGIPSLILTPFLLFLRAHHTHDVRLNWIDIHPSGNCMFLSRPFPAPNQECACIQTLPLSFKLNLSCSIGAIFLLKVYSRPDHTLYRDNGA